MAILSCFILAHPATAEETRDKQLTLIAVFPSHFPPIFDTTKNDVPTGFGIEVMEEIAARAGLRISYRSMPNWSAVAAALEAGQADLIPNMGITPERQEKFYFSQPLMRMSVSLYVRAGLPEIRGLRDLVDQNRVVATVKINVGEDLLKDYTKISEKSYNSVNEAFHALQAGEVDALIYPTPVVDRLIKKLDQENRIRRIGEPLTVIERAIAVRKDNQALLDRLNPVITEFVGTPRYRDIYDRWYGAPPPFWNTARVAYLIAGILGITLLLGFYARFRILDRANARLRAANELNAAVLATAVEGILTLDEQGVVRSANKAAEKIFGVKMVAGGGITINSLLTSAEAAQLLTHLGHLGWSTVENSWRGTANNVWESLGMRPGNEIFPIRLGIAPTIVGTERLFVCTIHDMTEQRRAENQVEYLADHDPVTGFLNQRGITLVLGNLLDLLRRQHKPLACLHIGLSRFAQINDTYGRQTGDAVMVQIGNFLSQRLREINDSGQETSLPIARLGGSRFLLVLPEYDLAKARALAETVLTGLARLEVKAGHERLRVDAKAGIVVFPEHGTTAEELIAHVESALLSAQEQRVGLISVYSQEMHHQETRAEQWLQRLHVALEQHDFVLHYQPVIEVASGELSHYEGLIRMTQTNGELIPPGEFIPIAERTGLIARVDYMAMEMAFSQLAALDAQGLNIKLAVNISAAHLGDDALFRWLENVFAEDTALPARLIFEITETTAVHNIARAKAFMEPLRALGCRFALDDFGVGFTSFTHLRSLPVDTVKIDGSFVRDLASNPENQSLVKAMTEVAHSLGKQVVAEFVESAEILEILRALGVDYAQGYHIGRPGPAPLMPWVVKTQPLQRLSTRHKRPSSKYH
ncbi:diguanylate cyclase [Sulfuricaulis limicola]|uniref:Diguanylate cyclase n=1 Tax=Sulfuricaulis limicola TaxID=1620215 RepID=A0A1B4XGX2_9GAMM|nr:EAL domain-containing protein [Sulfuricaulis limicola]BAV34054.1 diguanylate cyclase [Sulfuricaulis limicola]